jgi:hypothetical protein
MRVAQVRLAAPTASGLECVGFQASRAFLDKCKSDIVSTLVLTQLKRLTATSRSVQVPADAAQRAAIQADFPPPHFGDWDILKMRFFLWRRGLLKRS